MTGDTERLTTSAACPECGFMAPVSGPVGETEGFECINCGEPFEVTFR